jgi:hypothetical protein
MLDKFRGLRWIAIGLTLAVGVVAAEPPPVAIRPIAVSVVADMPLVQPLAPGFTVRELPVELTNRPSSR